MRIVFLINSLRRGGAELNLVRLAGALLGRGLDVALAPIRDIDADVRAEAEQRRVPILRVAGRGGVLTSGRRRIDLLEGWQYAGAAAASALAALSRRVSWNFRHVPVAGVPESGVTRALLRVLPRLPPVARIHVNSHTAATAHRRLGIRGDYRVIANGIDCERFVGSATARASLRQRLAIPPDAPVLAHVARFHPHKGHAGLLEAFASVAVEHGAYLLCMGQGMEEVRVLARRHAVPEAHLRLLDATADVVSVYSAADWVVSPSRTESFPTVVAEAMSCGRPCIATCVGDTADVVADTGIVVDANSVPALRAALLDGLSTSAVRRASLGALARARIVERFGLTRCTDAYVGSYREIVEAA